MHVVYGVNNMHSGALYCNANYKLLWSYRALKNINLNDAFESKNLNLKISKFGAEFVSSKLEPEPKTR